MSMRSLLGSTMLASLLAPALALAAPATLHPEAATLHAERLGTVTLRTLAGSAVNAAALANHPTHILALSPHRYPHAPAGGVLPRLTGATVTVAGPTVVSQQHAGFNGIYEGVNAPAIGGDLEPPDQGLAANNSQVFEIVNDSLNITDTAGKSLSGVVSNYAFFGLNSNVDSIGDPHVEYDASAGRWFVDVYDTSSAFNGFELAVSTSSDPMGSYVIYRLSATPKSVKGCFGSCFGDYPQPGYDANGFYIAADLFSNVTGQFVDAAVYALPKAALIAGATFNYQYFLLPDFVVEPSIPAAPGKFATSAGGTEFLMTARNIEDGSSNLRVYAITNTSAIAGATGLVINSVDVAAEPYTATVPQTQPDQVGPYGKSVGATHAPVLDGGYNAFGGGVKYLNGALYAALATGSVDANGLARDVIAWFEVKAAASGTAVTASIAGQGYIVPPTGYSLSYPGWALTAKGQGVIGTSITSPVATEAGGYPSAGFVTFLGGKFSTVYRVSGQGAASDDGFSGYQSAVGRWGDFSSATTDPVTGKIYVGNEYIPNTARYPRTTYANWGTFVTELP